MAISPVSTGDSLLNGILDRIRAPEYGKDLRSPLVDAVNRCFTLAILRTGSPRNGVTRDAINEHVARIRTAYYGEEVRDALKTVLILCHAAGDLEVSSAENNFLNQMIEAQTGEDIRNGMLNSIAGCGQALIRTI
mgnify:CR=1 FL=1